MACQRTDFEQSDRIPFPQRSERLTGVWDGEGRRERSTIWVARLKIFITVHLLTERGNDAHLSLADGFGKKSLKRDAMRRLWIIINRKKDMQQSSRHRPFILLNVAMTADGKLAPA